MMIRGEYHSTHILFLIYSSISFGELERAMADDFSPDPKASMVVGFMFVPLIGIDCPLYNTRSLFWNLRLGYMFSITTRHGNACLQCGTYCAASIPGN